MDVGKEDTETVGVTIEEAGNKMRWEEDDDECIWETWLLIIINTILQ